MNEIGIINKLLNKLKRKLFLNNDINIIILLFKNDTF
jgi:hypothetical protein